MKARDGKLRITDVATISQLLRIIQSIPSRQAEPFKLWLASVGSERINEVQDPELTINRAMREYNELGYSEAKKSNPHKKRGRNEGSVYPVDEQPTAGLWLKPG